ncbi:hypothetical protein ACU4HD_44730 (plasmid) [Cupriavidus basilensis]
MAKTKNATLVEAAIKRCVGSAELTKSWAPAMEGLDVGLFDSIEQPEQRACIRRKREPYAHALSLVNDHITVAQELIDEASTAYNDIANRLVSRLNWPRDAIKIFPRARPAPKR